MDERAHRDGELMPSAQASTKSLFLAIIILGLVVGVESITHPIENLVATNYLKGKGFEAETVTRACVPRILSQL
jgi:hypothetical protein